MELTSLWPIIGVPVIRAGAGWLENALKDGKISKLELKKLGETTLRLGIIGGAAYFGLNGMGIDVNIFASYASAAVLDFVIMALKKKK